MERESLDFKCVDNMNRLHPNQKPVELLEYLIRTYTLPGEVVLDPFAGSGSTLLGAKKLGRSFLGIESDEVHFQTMKTRLFGEDAIVETAVLEEAL